MKQREGELTEIIDEEVCFFQVKNEVIHEYVPIIGATGFMLYSFYKSMANRATGNIAFPSLELAHKHLGMATTTSNRYNWLLEACGLIYIIKGNARSNNVYRLLKVNPVTPELITHLTKVLQPNPQEGKEWARFKATTLESVKAWQPLRAHFKAKPTPPDPVADTDDQTTADTSPQSELVAQLVEMFKENKLSEAAAIKMITDYGEEAVKQQLAWLPARKSNTPLRILRAALNGNWKEPKPVGKPVIETEMMAALPPVETGHVAPPPPDPMWHEVKEILQMQLPQATYNTWIKPTELVQIEGNQWLIQCGSTFAQDWLENRLNGTLTRTASSVAGQGVELRFIVK